MIHPFRAISFVLVTAAAASAQEDAPWAQPRELSTFQALLDRSPFSLPTAEESSPLADRFTLTGAVAIDGDPLVFVLDKTTQTRHMLSKTPNTENMALVEYLPNTDPRQMRATIKVNGQIATISYAEPTTQPGQPPTPSANMPGSPASAPSVVVNAPATVTPGAPGTQTQSPAQPPRRVIRRRIISAQPPTGP